jgi:hypothetical protein
MHAATHLLSFKGTLEHLIVPLKLARVQMHAAIAAIHENPHVASTTSAPPAASTKFK